MKSRDDNFSEYSYQKPYFGCQVDELDVTTVLVEKPFISASTYQFNNIFFNVHFLHIHQPLTLAAHLDHHTFKSVSEKLKGSHFSLCSANKSVQPH